jgi:hypothetical protein
VLDATEEEKEFGLVIEAGSNAVDDGGDVLAHGGTIGAAAAVINFAGEGEEAVLFVGDDAHDFVGELALEEFEEGADFSGALFFKGVPFCFWEGLEGDFDGVDI